MSDEPKLAAAHERQWYIVRRWQEYHSEARANLLRTIGIGAFYIIELINHGAHLGALQLPQIVSDRLHAIVTALAVAWTMVALATFVCIRRQFLPPALKFVTTACDLVLLTAVLAVGDGPRSPMLVGYFLIIALAALRLSLRLVSMATLGAMAGYIFLLGYVKYYVDAERAATMSVPRYYELIALVSLALSGIILGQLICQVRTMAEDFSRRVS